MSPWVDEPFSTPLIFGNAVSKRHGFDDHVAIGAYHSQFRPTAIVQMVHLKWQLLEILYPKRCGLVCVRDVDNNEMATLVSEVLTNDVILFVSEVFTKMRWQILVSEMLTKNRFCMVGNDSKKKPLTWILLENGR